MIVNFNPVNFQQSCKIYKKGSNQVFEYYDDNDKLVRVFERDALNRDVDTKEFDYAGNEIFHMHKDYTLTGFIETVKDRFQEYTRILSNEKHGEFIHRIERYTSKTTPEKNYMTEFIRDASDRLVSVITDGKVIFKK